MKNIQVIDAASNSTFEIYQISDELFDVMFPNGTDIAINKTPHSFCSSAPPLRYLSSPQIRIL